MVSWQSTVALLGLIIGAASAAPIADAAAQDLGLLAPQASIFMCTNTYWNGACQNVLVTINECHNVPSGWNDQISSIRNDSRQYYKCTWYIDSDCRGDSYDNQEDANLADGKGKDKGRFNNAISSYSCKRK